MKIYFRHLNSFLYVAKGYFSIFYRDDIHWEEPSFLLIQSKKVGNY